MIGSFVDLVACMSYMWDYVITFVMCLMFVATVPCIVRQIISWR